MTILLLFTYGVLPDVHAGDTHAVSYTTGPCEQTLYISATFNEGSLASQEHDSELAASVPLRLG